MLIYLFYATRVYVIASVMWSLCEGLLCVKSNVNRKKVRGNNKEHKQLKGWCLLYVCAQCQNSRCYSSTNWFAQLCWWQTARFAVFYRKPLDIPEHISTSYLTHSHTHPLSLSLSPLSLCLTYPKTYRLFVLDFHGFFRVITLQDFITFSYMELQCSIECAK